MNTPRHHEKAARRSSDWLDTDESQGAADGSQLLEEQQVQVADLQLVDALLADLSPEADRTKAARIQRVMAAIGPDKRGLRTLRRHVRLKPVLAMAASLLVALGLFWAQPVGESRAEVVLREIGEVVLENIDRVYVARRETSASSPGQTVEGRLYLRGNEGFLFRWGDVVAGRDKDEFWLVPEAGPVTLARNFSWIVAQSERQADELQLLRAMSLHSRRVPIVELPVAVELLKKFYDISLASGEHNGRPVDMILGTLRRKHAHLPDRISLSADGTSRIIQRFSFHWGPADTIVFELAPGEEVPGNWYRHETHHAPRRKVRRVADEV